ncbi:MAG: multidrug efflux MFS transporter [Deltaproteobacteria bacterium]|nr:multidrug efflux MFS transporter [Deltaproteobacteria bacterium]
MSAETRVERANLWAVCAAQFLTLAGMTAVLPLIPLYLQHIGVVERDAVRYWTGILGSAPFIVAVFATPIWGAFADRVGHKPMVVRSVFGIALATVGMGVSGSPVALLGWRALQGAVSGVFPAAVALLASSTLPERVGRALAILQSARAAGSLCGPLIGGLLADLLGMRLLFFGVGAVAAVSALACAFVLSEPRDHAVRTAAGTAPVSQRDLLSDRPTLVMLSLLVLFQVMIMASWPSLALFVENLGVPRESVATTTGMVIFVAGVPAMFISTAWARLGTRFGVEPMMLLSLVLSGASYAAVGWLAHRVETLFVLRLLSGVSLAGFVPLSFHWLGMRAPESARGRMAGLASTAMMVGNVIGPLLGGWLAVHFDLAATFYVPGATLAVVGLAFAAVSAVRNV